MTKRRAQMRGGGLWPGAGPSILIQEGQGEGCNPPPTMGGGRASIGRGAMAA